MAYSYAVAKDILSEGEKNRLVCLYLNCETSTINWEKASQEYGAASVDSMRVSTRNILKKLVEKGGKMDAGVGTGASPGSAVKSTKKTPTSGKRKKAEVETNGNSDDDDDQKTPTKPKAKRGRPKKNQTAENSPEAEVEEADKVEEDDVGDYL